MTDLIKPRRSSVHATDSFDYLHGIDEDKAESFVEKLLDEGKWAFPPLILVEGAGSGYTVLDGHHRLEAAKRLKWSSNIPALIVDRGEFKDLLRDEFGGRIPERLADLDAFFDLPSGSSHIAKLGLGEASIARISKALF